MLKKLIKNKKAQQTAEYALLISLVVAAVIAMQTYAQRAIQARIRDASDYFVQETFDIGGTNQYEPYYLDSQYTVVRDERTEEIQDVNVVRLEKSSDRTRLEDGRQTTSFNREQWGLND